jgi:hypothetical protein
LGFGFWVLGFGFWALGVGSHHLPYSASFRFGNETTFVVHGPGALKEARVFKPDTVVVVYGLQAIPELNGKAAKVMKFNEELCKCFKS